MPPFDSISYPSVLTSDFLFACSLTDTLLNSAGTVIKVQIEEFSTEGKKLVLSMSFENRAEVGALSGVASSKWLNGVVQSVSPFGIFVRPAGYEMTGTFHPCPYLQNRDVCPINTNCFV